jgi:hypothetical protein
MKYFRKCLTRRDIRSLHSEVSFVQNVLHHVHIWRAIVFGQVVLKCEEMFTNLLCRKWFRVLQCSSICRDSYEHLQTGWLASLCSGEAVNLGSRLTEKFSFFALLPSAD